MGIPALEDAGLVDVEARHQDAPGEHEIGQGEAREGLWERLPRKHAIGERPRGIGQSGMKPSDSR